MKIAIVSPYDLAVPGGVQAHVTNLSDALRQLGHDATVLGPGDPDVPRPGVRPLGGSRGVAFNGSVAPIAVSPRAARRTHQALRELAPDVIHVHEPAVPAIGVTAALSKVAPVIGTFHAWSDRAGLYRAARPFVAPLARRLAARIAVSPAAVQYHASALGLSERDFTVIPNGVDVDRFGHGDVGKVGSHDGPTMLFVGRLERRKGLETAMRAFPSIAARHPDLRFLIVGQGPERDRCAALLPDVLRPRVQFVGRVGQSELPGYYAAADVFVAPALGGESFGIVLAEALAAGTAVVASDIPGYASVITGDRVGRLVAPGNVSALADAVSDLLDNDALRAAIVEEGLREVQQYAWPAIAERVVEVYEAALA